MAPVSGPTQRRLWRGPVGAGEPESGGDEMSDEMPRDGQRRASASELTPGQFVRHPGQPDWGLGQVQSAIGNRVTVNFEHAGKVLINAEQVSLDIVDL